jgi:hypothetical protein
VRPFFTGDMVSVEVDESISAVFGIGENSKKQILVWNKKTKEKIGFVDVNEQWHISIIIIL